MRAVVVHASDTAAAFYEHHGFRPLSGAPRALVVRLTPTSAPRASDDENRAVARLPEVGDTGLEPVTSCLSSRAVPHPCYDYGVARARISTTVDADLLSNARQGRPGLNDSALIEEALSALLARRREAEIDAAYSAYDAQPMTEPDAWGDLASFRAAAGAS